MLVAQTKEVWLFCGVPLMVWAISTRPGRHSATAMEPEASAMVRVSGEAMGMLFKAATASGTDRHFSSRYRRRSPALKPGRRTNGATVVRPAARPCSLTPSSISTKAVVLPVNAYAPSDRR